MWLENYYDVNISNVLRFVSSSSMGFILDYVSHMLGKNVHWALVG
jgi:hypothetical protein